MLVLRHTFKQGFLIQVPPGDISSLNFFDPQLL